MKKLLPILFLQVIICLGGAIKAQSPRMQLFEYFDNTSIPSFGAVANAHFDSLADANPDKLTFIKYHVAWGSVTGTDPMNLQNPDPAAARVTFYYVYEDPWVIQDGGYTADSTFNGNPENLTQANIDQRDMASSPFTISVSHHLNATGDSIQTRTVITKTGSTAAAPVLYVVVIEKLVHFSAAPNISGDVNFRNVMKQMLPSYMGMDLPSLNVGDSVIYDLNWKLANVYDTTELAVVSFLQDIITSEVYQAGYSAPMPQSIDAGIAAVNISPVFGCDSILPVATLHNFGTTALTNCTILSQIDGGPASSLAWSGNLASGNSISVSLAKIFATGYHQFNAFTSAPNGSADYAHGNDSSSARFAIAFPPRQGDMNEDFEDSLFPPSGWELGGSDPSLPWQRTAVGAFGTSSHSVELNWTNNWFGATDDLYPPALNLSANADTTFCTFDVAYSREYFNTEDTLRVNVSTDCGATWFTVYSKSDTSLATAPNTPYPFIPADSQWRHEKIDLSAYNGQADVQLQFRGISGYGNPVYIDNVNVNVAGSSGIASVTDPNYLHIFPNPGTGPLNIESGSFLENGTLQLFSIEGQKLMQLNNLTGNRFSLDISNQAKGIYFLQIANGQNNTVGITKFVLE